MRALSNEDKKKALEEIAAANGGQMSAELVVKAASDPDHVFHPHFEWDDAKAAHQYRLETARHLIRSVRIEVTITGGERVVVPIYVRDPEVEPDRQGYVSVSDLSRDDATAQAKAHAAILMEIANARAYLERALNLAEALGLSHLAAQLLMDLDKFRTTVEERMAS